MWMPWDLVRARNLNKYIHTFCSPLTIRNWPGHFGGLVSITVRLSFAYKHILWPQIDCLHHEYDQMGVVEFILLVPLGSSGADQD